MRVGLDELSEQEKFSMQIQLSCPRSCKLQASAGGG
jgi:hypothetical protein